MPGRPARWNSPDRRRPGLRSSTARPAPSVVQPADHFHAPWSFLMSRLAGKRALVTGGTSGIGLETAKQFLAEGARVIVTGVTPAHIEKASVELGSEVTVLRVDAADLAAQRELAQTVQDRFGSLDIAFLNAGVSDWRPMEAHDEASFDRLFTINVKSVFFLMQALVPVLANPSSVVLNSSASAHVGAATANAYAATKAAVSALMRS